MSRHDFVLQAFRVCAVTGIPERVISLANSAYENLWYFRIFSILSCRICTISFMERLFLSMSCASSSALMVRRT